MSKPAQNITKIISNPLFGYAVVFIIAVYVLYKLSDGFTALGNILSPSDSVDREDTLANPNSSRLSYPLINYTTYANAIEVALEMYWDDEDQVNFVFEQMNNNDDVLQLMKSFGVRKASPLGFWPSYTGTLSEWLSFNLTEEEVIRINEILNEKGITVQFA